MILIGIKFAIGWLMFSTRSQHRSLNEPAAAWLMPVACFARAVRASFNRPRRRERRASRASSSRRQSPPSRPRSRTETPQPQLLEVSQRDCVSEQRNVPTRLWRTCTFSVYFVGGFSFWLVNSTNSDFRAVIITRHSNFFIQSIRGRANPIVVSSCLPCIRLQPMANYNLLQIKIWYKWIKLCGWLENQYQLPSQGFLWLLHHVCLLSTNY